MANRALTLTLKLRRRADLLERWYANGRQGGVSLEGEAPGEVGQTCTLVVEIVEPSPRRFELQGRIAWARHKGSHLLRESYGVDIVDQHATGRARLLAYAREELPETSIRFERRLSTQLPVKILHDGMKRRESLIDLSQGGAFVRTSAPLAVNTELQCELRPPFSLTPVRLKCRVAWMRQQGPTAGMGLEFHYETAKQTRRIRKLLDKLAQQEAALSQGAQR